jgi:hypothetical protein
MEYLQHWWLAERIRRDAYTANMVTKVTSLVALRQDGHNTEVNRMIRGAVSVSQDEKKLSVDSISIDKADAIGIIVCRCLLQNTVAIWRPLCYQVDNACKRCNF